MADLFLWLAIAICPPLNKAEVSVPADMPNFQLSDEYVYPMPKDERACHWALWRQALAAEMAKRLKGNGE